MSNERIDLTQFEGYIEKLGLREGYHLHIVEEPNRAIGPWNKWEGGLVFDLGETSAHGIYAIPTARLMVAAPRLLAELKRCYEELDFLKANVLTDDDHWIATCKPDGEGQCTMEIEGYEELMRLDKEGKIEIPEYSHGYDELLLLEGCECGVTHDEWLESKN